jgi:hypothetical protein
MKLPKHPFTCTVCGEEKRTRFPPEDHVCGTCKNKAERRSALPDFWKARPLVASVEEVRREYEKLSSKERRTMNGLGTRVTFVCERCGKQIEVRVLKYVERGPVCSRCSMVEHTDYEARSETTKTTCLERYGATSVLADPKRRPEFTKTRRERRCGRYSDFDKTNATKRAKYGNTNNGEKARKTLLERYGHENFGNGPEALRKNREKKEAKPEGWNNTRKRLENWAAKSPEELRDIMKKASRTRSENRKKWDKPFDSKLEKDVYDLLHDVGLSEPQCGPVLKIDEKSNTFVDFEITRNGVSRPLETKSVFFLEKNFSEESRQFTLLRASKVVEVGGLVVTDRDLREGRVNALREALLKNPQLDPLDAWKEVTKNVPGTYA